jgi:hypothetical protein
MYIEKYGMFFEKNDIKKIENRYFINELPIKSKDEFEFKCLNCGKKIKSQIKTFYRGKKYELCIDCSRKKSIFEKYGVENISQLKEVHDKIKKSMIERHGVDNPSKSKIIREKTKQTCFKKYGNENAGGSKIIQKKILETMKNKYGSHYFQTKESIEGNRHNFFGIKRGHYITKFRRDLYFASNEELKFIKEMETLDLDVKNGPHIKYILNNKEHYYFIDFEVENLLIEIKSSHIWYIETLASGEIDAKKKAAKKYARSVGKKFLFLLDEKNYSIPIKENIYGKNS